MIKRVCACVTASGVNVHFIQKIEQFYSRHSTE